MKTIARILVILAVAFGVVGATVLVAQTSLATSLVGSGQGHGGFQAGQASPQMRDALGAPPQGSGASHQSAGGIDVMSLSVVGKNVAIIAGMTVLYALAASVYRYGSGAWMKE